MEIEVGHDREGQRLDVIMAQEGGMSRRAARRLIESGAVFVDDKRTRVQSRVLDGGARIQWSATSPPVASGDLRIIARAPDYIVVDKPAGMPTEPTRQGSVGTVLETLRVFLKREGEASPSLAAVHRLDVNTSGVVIIAQTKEAAAALSEPFRSGQVQRRYLALAHGKVEDAAITIDAPLARGRDPGHVVVDRDGKRARTLVAPLARGVGSTLASVIPMTGRMHQIRVHLAEIGHPIVGDVRYGASFYAGAAGIDAEDTEAADNAPFCLHALSLSLVDPRTGERLAFASEPPSAFVAACARIDIPASVVATAARPEWGGAAAMEQS